MKTISFKKFHFVIVLLLFPFVRSIAQNNLSSDTFMVVKAYQPVLLDADKINFEPEIIDTVKIEHDLKYNFISKEIPVKTEVEAIKAARVKSEALVKLYNGYAKLGFGNNYTPWAEVFYHNLRSDEFALGTHLKYTYFNGIDDLDNTQRSNGHFEIFGKKFWKQNTLQGALAYDFTKFKYYGFSPVIVEEVIEDAPIDQAYNLISGDFNLSSTIRDSFNLRHAVDLAFHYLSEKNNADELNLKTNINLSKIENTELYNLDVGVDFNQVNNSWDSLSNAIVSVIPSIKTSGDIFTVKGGMGIYMQADNSAKFSFYPDVEFTANLIDNILVPYAGINGGIKRNSYRSITDENIYVNDSIEILNSNVKYNAYFGIRGTFSSRVAFNANFTKRKVDNFLMFVKDTTTTYLNKFTSIYDEVEEMKIKGEISYSMNQKISLYLIGEYFGYNPLNETEVWHQADKKFTLSGLYNLHDKIIARLDIIYFGDQFAKSYSDEKVDGLRQVEKINIGGIFDANVGLEYRYTKKVSAFLNFNNIASSSYQKWQDYRLQKFNFMGGFTYAF